MRRADYRAVYNGQVPLLVRVSVALFKLPPMKEPGYNQTAIDRLIIQSLNLWRDLAKPWLGTLSFGEGVSEREN